MSDGYRAGGGHPFKAVAVVALDHVGSVFRQHPGGQQEELFGALHLLAHRYHTQSGHAVTGAGVGSAAQKLQGAALTGGADEGLDSHTGRVHTQGIFHIAGDAAAVGHVVIENGGVVGHPHALGHRSGAGEMPERMTPLVPMSTLT